MRYFTFEGELVSTPQEAAEQAQQQAEQAQQQVEDERRQREQLLTKLWEHGIDPDTL